MKRSVLTALLVLCCAAAFADQAPEKKDDKADKADKDLRTLKAEPFKVTLKLDGIYESQSMTPVRVDLDEWKTQSIKVVDGTAQGTHVKTGDVLIRFETDVIDRMIDGMEQGQALAQVNINALAEEVAIMDQTVPLDLEMAKRNHERTTADYDQYVKTEREQWIDRTKQSLRLAEQRFEYVSEELRQLEKMYTDDDLTEETEEIVLTRQRNAVQDAKFALDRKRYETEKTLETFVPRRDEDWKRFVRDAELNLERAQKQNPLTLAQKKQTLAKMRFDYDQTTSSLQRLKSDRQKLIVKAPVDGVVYYGRYEQGQWKEAATIDNVIHKEGGFRPGATLMTIVQPQPLRITCTVAEKQLYKAKPGVTGWAIPTGFPDRPAKVKLETVAALPIESGQYDTVLSVTNPEGVHAGMTCNIRLNIYSQDNALTLPSSAINTDDPTRPFVKLVDADGGRIERPVKLGWRDGDRIEIVDGLKAGDKVQLDVHKREADKD
ncbi:HlyD family efflux transporter periplasmic adaptor subunit [Planctomycetales bacterium ZRK34]|nr:HlyD family efflux transporter periplasmic adaptor subunit [Planctomycetales bacterium ZRK34]